MATAFRSTGTSLPFIHPDDMPDQFALKGVGTCMAPLIADGALLVCDKREEPLPGDIVSLIFTREVGHRSGSPGMVKRLAMALPPWNLTGDAIGLVIVDQINPPRRYCIPTSDLLAVHKVIGTAEPDGEGRAKFRPAKVEAWS